MGLWGPVPGGQLPQLGCVGRVERTLQGRCQVTPDLRPHQRDHQPALMQHLSWYRLAGLLWSTLSVSTLSPDAGAWQRCTIIIAIIWGPAGSHAVWSCRRFVKGDAGMKASFATRVAGSADLYAVNNRWGLCPTRQTKACEQTQAMCLAAPCSSCFGGCACSR